MVVQGPSRSAIGVARAFSLARHDPDCLAIAPPGAPESTAAMLAGLSDKLRLDHRMQRYGAWRALWRLLDRHGPMRGAVLHLSLRKRWFEDQVEAALAEGYTQLIVVGAGFDLLAWRIAKKHKDSLVFEIDSHVTQHEKRKAIGKLGKRPKRLRFVVIDLAAGALDRCLITQKRFDPTRSTVLVAEGVLMYLAERDAMYVLRSAALLPVPRCRVLFSFLGASGSGGPHAGPWDRTVRSFMRFAGEPFKYAIDPAKIAEVCRGQGLELNETCDEKELLRRYATNGAARGPLLEWEYVARAERIGGGSERADLDQTAR